MTFRQEIDNRLSLIQESSVTDEEYAALTVPGSPITLNYYEACESVLDARGDIGNAKDRLNALALATDNLIFNSVPASSTNIFLGADLEN